MATQDIGWFAAQSFLDPDGYRNKAPTLVGDELAQPDADAIFNTIVWMPMPMSDTVGDMFKWFKAEGYGGDVEACRKAYPEMQSVKTKLEVNKGRWTHWNSKSFSSTQVA